MERLPIEESVLNTFKHQHGANWEERVLDLLEVPLSPHKNLDGLKSDLAAMNADTSLSQRDIQNGYNTKIAERIAESRNTATIVEGAVTQASRELRRSSDPFGSDEISLSRALNELTISGSLDSKRGVLDAAERAIHSGDQGMIQALDRNLEALVKRAPEHPAKKLNPGEADKVRILIDEAVHSLRTDPQKAEFDKLRALKEFDTKLSLVLAVARMPSEESLGRQVQLPNRTPDQQRAYTAQVTIDSYNRAGV